MLVTPFADELSGAWIWAAPAWGPAVSSHGSLRVPQLPEQVVPKLLHEASCGVQGDLVRCCSSALRPSGSRWVTSVDHREWFSDVVS